jgi:hypothetical protein
MNADPSLASLAFHQRYGTNNTDESRKYQKRSWGALFLFNLFLCLSSLPESILEFAGHGLHVTHASSSFRAATLGLCAPVELSHLLCGVSAGRASRLLDVVRSLSATTASRVGLVMSLTEGGGTLCL